ncbi:MAG: TolC family protein [Pseudomonadota bacterium]
MHKRSIVVALYAAFFLGGSVQAQNFNADLKSVIEHAWQRAVAAHTLEGKRQEVQANRLQANALFAGVPAIGLANRQDRWTTRTGTQENEVSLSAPIWLPGQRSARNRLLDAESTQTESAMMASKLNLAGEIRERLWALVAIEAECDLAKKRVKASEALETDIKKRVKAGDLSRADALLARQETLNAQSALQDAEIKRVEALARWEVLTGLKTLPAHVEEAVQSASDITHHPRLLAAYSARLRAEKHLQLVAATRRDSPEVGVNYRWEQNGNLSPNIRTIGMAVKIPFATEGRNRPLEAAAQTEIATAVAEERIATETILAELKTAKVLLEQTELRLRLSEERHMAAKTRAALIQKAFELGDQSLMEWLRARAPVLEAEATLARDRAALGLARARLNQAQGILP